jgi:hypothetical protein
MMTRIIMLTSFQFIPREVGRLDKVGSLRSAEGGLQVVPGVTKIEGNTHSVMVVSTQIPSTSMPLGRA